MCKIEPFFRPSLPRDLDVFNKYTSCRSSIDSYLSFMNDLSHETKFYLSTYTLQSTQCLSVCYYKSENSVFRITVKASAL